MPDAPLKLRIASRLDALPALVRAVSDWCAGQQLPDAEASRLALMVDELVTNTVLHGYGGRDDGWVELRLRRQGDVLHLVLSDGAAHFDPTRRPPRVPQAVDDDVDTRPMGGLGIDFVRRLVQRWQHDALPQGNRLQLWRRIGQEPRPARR